jgi:peptidoglycan hydrolase CwlO-like protein
MVKKVLESLADNDLTELQNEVADATKKVNIIEEEIENLKALIPDYKNKIKNRKLSLTDIDYELKQI